MMYAVLPSRVASDDCNAVIEQLSSYYLMGLTEPKASIPVTQHNPIFSNKRLSQT
jgi:hypothetical protein